MYNHNLQTYNSKISFKHAHFDAGSPYHFAYTSLIKTSPSDHYPELRVENLP